MKFVIQKGNILGTAAHILSKLRKCSDPLIQDKLYNVEIPQQDHHKSTSTVISRESKSYAALPTMF